MSGIEKGYRNRLFRAVHAEAKKRKLDHDALRDMAREAHGVHSLSELSDAQLSGIYRQWTGHVLKRRAALPRRGEANAAALQIVTAEDIALFDAEVAKRGWGPETRAAFLRRQLRGRTELRTRQDVVRATAGVRAMNRRDGLV